MEGFKPAKKTRRLIQLLAVSVFLNIAAAGAWPVHAAEVNDTTPVPSPRIQTTYTAELAKQGAGWMIITGDGGSVADLIETGRRFERMALMVREIGIAIHPMTQILEEKQWRDRYDSLHKSSMVPQLVLRVGYLDSYPDPVSLRMPVESFLRA